MILSRPGHCLLSGTNLSKLSRADHQRSGQAKKTEFHIPDGVSTVVSGNNVYVCDCAGDPVPSPAGDRLDGHGELVGGGLPVQAHGLPQVSGVILYLVIIVTRVFFRIFGFYASGFILIVISLDR